MSLTPGTRLGPYEILSPLGAGGMGEVYRATDSNLKRSVAVKVLPASVADDAARLARFQREAEILAALNHPNIAAIYGLEKTADFTALVMELVEGEDLSQRIARRPIPLDEALPIATQIAEALEAAHEQGIIHRDLKPANVKVRADGTVKVLDFGLAKAIEQGSGIGDQRSDRGGRFQPDLSASPTITSPAMLTSAGMILGTASYMAPEQARGNGVDRRADLWAVGCVLYEMLTGARAFPGEQVVDTLAAVLSREPDWSALPASTPASVRRILRRCLEKDRRRRLSDAADLRLDIEDALSALPADVVPPPRSQWSTRRLAAVTVVGVLLTAVGAAVFLRAPAPTVPAPSELRTDIVTPATSEPGSFALSPDGRYVVFVASEEGTSRLWLRSLLTTKAQPLQGTEDANFPFWSPDSRSIAFFAGGELRRLDLSGGAPTRLAAAPAGRGGAWGPDGTILFGVIGASTSDPLYRIAASGGVPVKVTTLDRQTSHRFPVFLPDGRHFLFYAQGALDRSGIFLGSLDEDDTVRLVQSGTAGAFLSPDWLLFTRDGTLLAQRIDVERRILMGDPVTVGDRAGGGDTTAVSGISVSAQGLIAYRSAAGLRKLRWFDRKGTALGSLGQVDDAALAAISLSPDGLRAVVTRATQGSTDLWLVDAVRLNRFTFDPGQEMYPQWSPDGKRIAFSSERSGQWDLYDKPVDGSEEERPFGQSDRLKTLTDWSRDGRYVIYITVDPVTGRDLWFVQASGSRTPRPFLITPAQERWARFSPDGRWVAYQSTESRRAEIYIRPFSPDARPDAATTRAGQWQVSVGGGVYPVWRADGHELYFIAPKGELMAASFSTNGPTPDVGSPVALFQTRIVGGGADSSQGYEYDVTRDGRFLINSVPEDVANQPITLIQHWTPPAR